MNRAVLVPELFLPLLVRGYVYNHGGGLVSGTLTAKGKCRGTRTGNDCLAVCSACVPGCDCSLNYCLIKKCC